MLTIPLQALPNQTFSVQLDAGFFGISLKTIRGVTSVSIALDNVALIQNMRAVPGANLIPSRYQESGNFLFVTANFELPIYTKFGISQSLVYVTGAELAVFREPVTPPISVEDFNPIAALPLRFSPQGY